MKWCSPHICKIMYLVRCFSKKITGICKGHSVHSLFVYSISAFTGSTFRNLINICNMKKKHFKIEFSKRSFSTKKEPMLVWSWCLSYHFVWFLANLFSTDAGLSRCCIRMSCKALHRKCKRTYRETKDFTMEFILPLPVLLCFHNLLALQILVHKFFLVQGQQLISRHREQRLLLHRLVGKYPTSMKHYHVSG